MNCYILVLESVPYLWYTSSMDKDSCLIYEGEHYILEWYYDEDGYSQAYEYFLETSDVQKRKFLMLAKKMGDFGIIYDKSKFRNEGDSVYAFKPQPDRYLCFFFSGKKIIVTNAYQKKSNKLPKGEKELALKNMAKYKLRHNETNQ